MTATAVETLHERSVDVIMKLHSAKMDIRNNLNTLRLETIGGSAMAEQRSTLGKALTNTLVSALMDAAAFNRFIHWHLANTQCILSTCKPLNFFIKVDGGILTTAEKSQPMQIAEQWM